MNVNSRRIFKGIVAVFLTAVISFPSLGLGETNLEQSPIPDENIMFMREAGGAVVDRVFGVKDGGGEIDYYAFDLSGHSRFNSTLRSAFVPGWGQTFNRQKTKGVALFITTVSAGLGSYYMYHKSQDTYNEYKNYGAPNSSLYDSYESEQKFSVLLGSAALLLWGYSIVDAYRGAYNPLWTKDNSIQLAYTDRASQIYWNHKFK